jgi:hypothetical protein
MDFRLVCELSYLEEKKFDFFFIRVTRFSLNTAKKIFLSRKNILSDFWPKKA